ncbi:MAG: type II secretion system F family protein [Planctomycetota bacterium]|nr:type II secretion system F family protein [Planctomycetota bacterium]
MPIEVIYVLIVLFFAVLGMIVVEFRKFEFDYSVMPDLMRRRREAALEGAAVLRMVEPLTSGFAALVPLFGLDGHRARTRQLLVHSGNPDGHTAETFIGFCMGIAVLAYTGVFLLFLLFSGEVRPFIGILPAFIAYIVPHMNLKTQAESRRVLIDRHMPYFLDLMSLTMGAGSTFLEATETITQGQSAGPLVDELTIMLAEVRAGTRFTDALANMTKRSDSEELALMVQAVRQGEELGTPLVDVFEVQASTNRYRRTKRGEQLAAKLPNRLAVPNTVLMLAVLLLLFGPIIVKATRGDLM